MTGIRTVDSKGSDRVDVTNLYDSLFAQLAIASSSLPQQKVDAIHEQILSTIDRCSDACVSAAAQQALHGLSAYLDSQVQPGVRDSFRRVLRPWMELLQCRADLDTVNQDLEEVERSGRSDDNGVRLLLSLTGRVDQLRQQIAALEAETTRPQTREPPAKRAAREPAAAASASDRNARMTGVAASQECAGLRNRNNRCFVNGVVKALWASQAFRQLVASKARRSRIALALDHLFTKFDHTPPSVVLEPHDEAVQGLLTEIGRRKPELLDGHQHDASELLNYIFDDMLAGGESLLSYDVTKERPERLRRENGFNFAIPAIDLPEHSYTNIFDVHLQAHKGPRVDLQEAMTSFSSEELIDPEDLIRSDRNAGRAREILDAIGHRPQRANVRQNIVFRDPPPPCLLVQLVPNTQVVAEIDPQLRDLSPQDRAIIEADAQKKTVKIPTQVDIPQVLTTRSASGRAVRYTLKSVVIHKGQDGSGHYFAYLPAAEGAPAAAAASPSQLVCHNDEEVRRVLARGAQADLARDAYLVVYDLDPSSP
jgi:hypothetical protein